MSRPSRNADQRLVQAARDLIPETGFSKLKLRKVAERAGVNLGMFHYHFKNKQDFVQRVMQEIYEEFFRKFTLDVSNVGDPPQIQLRKAILAGAYFLRDNRQMILSLACDAMEEDQDIIRFLEKNFHRHIGILVTLLRRCQRARVIAAWPLPVVIGVLAGSVLGPSIIAAVVERIRFHTTYEILKKALMPQILSDQVIETRLALALEALRYTQDPRGRAAGSNVKTGTGRKPGKEKALRTSMNQSLSSLLGRTVKKVRRSS